MICAAVKSGLKVGITAVSHKVISNLLKSAVDAAKEAGLDLRCVQKVSKKRADELPDSIVETTDNSRIFSMLQSCEAQVAAGTAWLWTREEAEGSIDILFVDEAGQISLANTVAVSLARSPATGRNVTLRLPQSQTASFAAFCPRGLGSA